MENHKIDAPDDVPAHVNHKPQSIVHTRDNDHDVFDVARHLGEYEEGPQSHLANRNHDDAAHFTTNPSFAKSGQQDPPKMSEKKAFREVFTDKPSTVDRSKSVEGQHKQMVAIALSKAGKSKEK